METTLHTRLDSTTRDQLALYLLGGMSEAEARDLETHLDLCPACNREVDHLRPVVEGLALSAPEAAPPLELFGRLMERVRSESFTFLPDSQRAWIGAGVPGVELCQLHLDTAQERQTLLIRMEPGATLPQHLHGGTEECFIVRGDLRDRDLRLQATDYIRFEKGTSHSVVTEQGCLLYVTSSLRDRALQRGKESPEGAIPL